MTCFPPPCDSNTAAYDAHMLRVWRRRVDRARKDNCRCPIREQCIDRSDMSRVLVTEDNKHTERDVTTIARPFPEQAYNEFVDVIKYGQARSPSPSLPASTRHLFVLHRRSRLTSNDHHMSICECSTFSNMFDLG